MVDGRQAPRLPAGGQLACALMALKHSVVELIEFVISLDGPWLEISVTN